MFQINRGVMTLGCALPNLLPIGFLIFKLGSQMSQHCSFQMV